MWGKSQLKVLLFLSYVRIFSLSPSFPPPLSLPTRLLLMYESRHSYLLYFLSSVFAVPSFLSPLLPFVPRVFSFFSCLSQPYSSPSSLKDSSLVNCMFPSASEITVVPILYTKKRGRRWRATLPLPALHFGGCTLGVTNLPGGIGVHGGGGHGGTTSKSVEGGFYKIARWVDQNISLKFTQKTFYLALHLFPIYA